MMERLDFVLSFRWFVGLGIDDPVWDASSFSKNRERLLNGEIAARFLSAILARPQVKRLLSTEHFSVVGSLIGAWCSMKSFRPKAKVGADEPPTDGPGSRNGEVDFRGTRRSNELPDELPQGFHDVITLQRGNAFLFDDAGFAASNPRGTLALTALLENDGGGFLKPRYVALDDLDGSTGRAVFLEDRRSDRLLAYCKAGREKWWEAFKQAPPTDFDYPFDEPCFIPPWDSIKNFVPELRPWKRRCWDEQLVRGDRLFAELAAILFSIAHTAMAGRDRVYITRFSDGSALTSMLKAKLGAQAFMPFATLIETMLSATPARERLERMSVARSFALAKQGAEQVRPGDPVWAGATRPFPEVFDGLRRAELADLGKLPAWAGGAAAGG